MANTKNANNLTFLQKAILSNAIFSGFSGIAFLIFSNTIASFLGDIPSIFVAGTGIVLILYAPMLFIAANKQDLAQNQVWTIIILDILWVLGSLVLVFTDLAPLSTPGKWAIAIVADIIALFAILQYIGLRKKE